MNSLSDHTSKPVRLGLVGLGGHGLTIQQAVRAAPNVQAVAVYDPVGAEAEAAAERFSCERAASYEALLARGDLEAVALVSPNAFHRTQAEAAFAAGLDVFVEKPIANTVADGRVMVEAAERAGRLLMVGHNMRFSRAAHLARRWLDADRLGRLVSVEVHFSTDNARHLQHDAWRLRPDLCPLLPVMQLGIHAIDLVHYFAGPIREVYGQARSVTTRPGVVDNVVGTFRLEGDVLGTLVSNYCSQIRFAYRLAGTEGTLWGTPHDLHYRRNADTDGRGDGPVEAQDFRAYDRESYALQMQAFGEAVRGRTAPPVDGWAGLQALAVVEALQRSVEAKTPQPVPLLGGRAPTCCPPA